MADTLRKEAGASTTVPKQQAFWGRIYSDSSK